MKNGLDPIVAWASFRAIHLYNLHRYEDSYAISQEFLEWTTPHYIYSDELITTVLKVPNLNKENRTKNFPIGDDK